MKRIAAVSLLAIAGAGGAWWFFAPTAPTVVVGAPAPLPSRARTPAAPAAPLRLQAEDALDAATADVPATPAPQTTASGAPPSTDPAPDSPSRADTTFQAVLADMSSRVQAYATESGLDEAGAQAAADAIGTYLQESHNVHLAVRSGQMTRQAATAELADLHDTLESDLRDRLGDEGYEGLRGAVPGKW